ncbi:MAG: hypothetical protein CI949_3005, partial [Halanaerobium sp.]
NGGEGGIRTLGRFEPTPAFQAGPLSQTRTPLRKEVGCKKSEVGLNSNTQI